MKLLSVSVEFNGIKSFDKSDIKEDIHGIILGSSDYTKNYIGNKMYYF